MWISRVRKSARKYWLILDNRNSLFKTLWFTVPRVSFTIVVTVAAVVLPGLVVTNSHKNIVLPVSHRLCCRGGYIISTSGFFVYEAWGVSIHSDSSLFCQVFAPYRAYILHEERSRVLPSYVWERKWIGSPIGNHATKDVLNRHCFLPSLAITVVRKLGQDVQQHIRRKMSTVIGKLNVTLCCGVGTVASIRMIECFHIAHIIHVWTDAHLIDSNVLRY